MDGLIDDEVRESFPGWSDEDIYEFYRVAKKAESIVRPIVFETDISHARIIKHLGWQAFREYLCEAVGHDRLDAEDYIVLAGAVEYLCEIENSFLYSAMFSSASEATSKKTVSARKESLKKLTSRMSTVEFGEGV